jgi:hypothetical protein
VLPLNRKNKKRRNKVKKTVSLILALVLICTTLFSLTSCGTSQEDIDKAIAEAITPLNAEIEELKNQIKDLQDKINNSSNNDSNEEDVELHDHTTGTIISKNAIAHSYGCAKCSLNISSEEHEFVNDECTICGYMKYIYFGEYPQTIKAEGVTITGNMDSRGYYLGSDGCYYAMIIATPFVNFAFSNGTTIVENTVYYFKVEPIRWRVLSEENGEIFILCDSIIANMAYQSKYYTSGDYVYTDANGAPEGTYANNYEYSEVRNWLNSVFYENAFSYAEREKILTTIVDNSGGIIDGIESNPYACRDTEDKLFLLSFDEATNTDYGFSSTYYEDNARRYLVSDYSLATGAVKYNMETYGMWWLRTPYYWDSYGAHGNDGDGRIAISGHLEVYLTPMGVVPALKFTR